MIYGVRINCEKNFGLTKRKGLQRYPTAGGRIFIETVFKLSQLDKFFPPARSLSGKPDPAGC